MSTITHIDAQTVARLLGPAGAVEALRRALQSGFDPAQDHARIADPLEHGEFLLMPSETATAAGVKVLTVAPGNPALGLQRIQGLYLLFDATTLTPTHLVDGPALTDLRTSAVSVAAIYDALLGSADPLDVVVYGAGPQAVAHVRTLEAVLDGRRAIASISTVVRTPERVDSTAPFTRVLRSGSDEAHAATAAAGLILCTTTARTPLFPGDLVRDDAVVVAVGSHEPDARELDADLMARADVAVEAIDVALRECGDVIMAIDEGKLSADRLLTMRGVVTGQDPLSGDRPFVFKSAGMPWQDLVIAEAIAAAHDGRGGTPVEAGAGAGAGAGAVVGADG